jgi:hypothetical protein
MGNTNSQSKEYGVIHIISGQYVCRLRYRNDVSGHICNYFLKNGIKHDLELGKTHSKINVILSIEQLKQVKILSRMQHIQRIAAEIRDLKY